MSNVGETRHLPEHEESPLTKNQVLPVSSTLIFNREFGFHTRKSVREKTVGADIEPREQEGKNEEFLRKGVDFTNREPVALGQGNSLLFAAITGNAGVVRMLLNSKMPLSSVDSEGSTALHLACGKGHVKVVKILLDAKADTAVVNKRGETALHLAVAMCYVAVVKMLLAANADITLPDDDGATVMDLASRNTDIGIQKAFVEHCLTPKFETFEVTSASISTLTLSNPFNVSIGGLCCTILDSTDIFYDLPNAGFALGLDVLPQDASLWNPMDAKLFSGIRL